MHKEMHYIILFLIEFRLLGLLSRATGGAQFHFLASTTSFSTSIIKAGQEEDGVCTWTTQNILHCHPSCRTLKVCREIHLEKQRNTKVVLLFRKPLYFFLISRLHALSTLSRLQQWPGFTLSQGLHSPEMGVCIFISLKCCWCVLYSILSSQMDAEDTELKAEL